VADPAIFAEGGGGGRLCVSLVVIYRKCTQRTIYDSYGKRRLIEKILSL